MFKKLSIFGKLTISFVLIITLIVCTFIIIDTHKEAHTKDKQSNQHITLIAEMISNDYRTIESLKNNCLDKELNTCLDTISDTYSIDLIRLESINKTKLYQSPEARLEKLSNTNKKDSNSNKNITQSHNLHDCYKHAIHSEEDELLGYLTIGPYKSTPLMKNLIITKVSFSILLSIIFLLTSAFISKKIRTFIFANRMLKAKEFYLEKTEIFNNLSEGILLINNSQLPIYSNAAAKKIINSLYSNNYSIKEFVQKDISPFLSNLTLKNNTFKIKEIDVSIDEIDLFDTHNGMGTIITLKNNSELITTIHELETTKKLVESIRTTNHEHKNKLHVILGLLQLNCTKKAINYIKQLSYPDNKLMESILKNIKNQTIAALIISKVQQANELNISFKLDSTSYLEQENEFLDDSEIVAIIGNLLENSFEAFNFCKVNPQVTLLLTSNKDSFVIKVSDNACGIDSTILDNVFDIGISSKGDGRGIGMNIIKSLVDIHNGDIDIQTSSNGTTIKIIIKNKKEITRKEY